MSDTTDKGHALTFGQLVVTLLLSAAACLCTALAAGFGVLASIALAYLGGAVLTLVVAGIAVALTSPARAHRTVIVGTPALSPAALAPIDGQQVLRHSIRFRTAASR